MFDRDLLTADPDAVASMLEISLDMTPTPEPPTSLVPATPRFVDSMLSWAADLLRNVDALCTEAATLRESIALIQQSVVVALANVQLHANNIKSATTELMRIAQKDFERMEQLLHQYTADLDILRRVRVHPQLVRRSASGGTASVLCDVVDVAHVHRVAASCRSAREDVRALYERVMETESRLARDLRDLTHEIEQTDVKPSIETYEQIVGLQEQVHAEHASLVSMCQRVESPSNPDWLHAQAKAEALYARETPILHTLDCLVQDRNELLYRDINLVQDISGLQSDFTELSALVAHTDVTLESSLNDGFQVLEHVHSMYGAYGALLAEAVRRSEFKRMYLAKAQCIAELMAKLSEKETKRRKRLWQDLNGAWPWESPCMDLSLPVFDITTRCHDSSSSTTYTQEDLAEFHAQLHALDREMRTIDSTRSVEHDVHTYMRRFASEPHNFEEDFCVLARRELGLEDMAESSEDEAIDSVDGNVDDDDDTTHEQSRRERA